MSVKPFPKPKEQMCQLGKHRWHVIRLFALAEGLPVMNVPLGHINMFHVYDRLTLRELAGHMVAVQEADLSCPIILDEDGEIMDGRHRLMKAIIDGEKTIKAVRFTENPEPCRVDE